MPRFFIAGTNTPGVPISITGADAEHIRVLRMRVGEKLIICDGSGTDHHCRLTKIGDGYAEAEVDESVASTAEPTVDVTVLAGLPKGEKADYLIQKCIEAGAARIVFFLSERCIVRVDRSGAEKKLGRWQKIAEGAAQQSGRGTIPEVELVLSFAEALDKAIKADLPLLLYEAGDRVALKDAIEAKSSFTSAALITGPEGGFEPYEVELAKAAGIPICSMGPRILRCETAPVVALSAVMYATNNL